MNPASFETRPWCLGWLSPFAVFVLAGAFAGCTSTNVQRKGNPLSEPLCIRGVSPVPVAIYWTTHWRDNQKEPALRADLAERGIRLFTTETPGLEKAPVQRLSTSAIPPDDALWKMAAEQSSKPGKLVLIVVRELGPTLGIGLPFLVRGGTEVVLDVRVLDSRSSGPSGQFQTRWENGGLFVIKGVRTLSRDMKSALDAALLQTAGGKRGG